MNQSAIIRRNALRALVESEGLAVVAKRAGKPDRQINDMIAGRKSFGEKVAREIERALDPSLPQGWLDRAGPPEVPPQAAPARAIATVPAMTVKELMTALESVLALARVPIDALAYPTRADLESRLEAALLQAGNFVPKRRPQATVWLPKRLSKDDIPGEFIDHKQLPAAAKEQTRTRKKA